MNYAPYKKDEADFTNQAANVQIMISLLIAMALKSSLPHPEDPESIWFGELNLAELWCPKQIPDCP